MLTLTEADHALVAAAMAPLDQIPETVLFPVTSAAITKSGQIFVGSNVFHFTGGPCAEHVVFGSAALQGFRPRDLVTIVAMKKETRKVINPCGKCRQMMRDFCSEIRVIVVDDEGNYKIAGVKELLPFAYAGRSEEEFRVTETLV